MIDRIIYSKDTKGIQKLNISFDDEELAKIRDELIDFYGLEFEEREFTGPYPEYDEVMSMIKIIDAVPISLSHDVGLPVYKFKYLKVNLRRLSRIINNILFESNRMNLSFLINDLYNFDCNSVEEEKYKNRIINCMNYEIARKDLRTRALDRQERRYSESNYIYYDDTKEIDLPKTYRLGIKTHDDF